MNKFLLATLLCLLALCSTSCSSSVNSEPKSDKPIVLASIGTDAYFLKTIGNDHIDVVTVVPPGASPHFFEPQPRQANELKDAKIWFLRGEMFEKRLLKSLQRTNPSLSTYDLRDGLDLISASCGHSHHNGPHDHHHADEKDLHTWVSPKMAVKNIEMMSKALIKSFPEHKDAFSKNTICLINKITSYDRAISNNLKSKAKVSIIVSHPAFAYFCRDYDIEQLSIEVEGKEPSPRQIDNIMKTIATRQVSHIFIQMQYNNKGAIAIADMTGIAYSEVNPYSEDYFEMLKTLSESISGKPLEKVS